MQDVEECGLIQDLRGVCDIAMLLRELPIGLSRGTQEITKRIRVERSELGSASLPREIDSFRRVPEKREVEAKPAAIVEMDEALQSIDVPGCAIGSEPHHL